jgi:hypothetical protein
VTPLLAAVHVLSYPVLVWLVWVWLGIAESSIFELIGSVVLALLVVAAVAWLLATAFEGSLRVSRPTWMRSLLFTLACLLLIGATLWLAANRRTYPALWWTAFAAVIAVLLPPHFVLTWRVLRDWRYWAACAALVLVGGYGPWKVVSWVPAAKTLAAQATSMAIRFAAAYLLSVVMLLVFASVVRRLAARPTSPIEAT